MDLSWHFLSVNSLACFLLDIVEMLWFCWSKPSIHGNLTSSSVSRPADLGPCLPSWAWHFRCYMTQIHPQTCRPSSLETEFPMWKSAVTSNGKVTWGPSLLEESHETHPTHASTRGEWQGRGLRAPNKMANAGDQSRDGWKRWCPFGKNHGFDWYLVYLGFVLG